MTAHVAIKEDFFLGALLTKQREAFLKAGPPTREERRADLLKLKRAILARRSAFEAAVSKDFGYRPAYETRIMEVIPMIQAINFARRKLGRWMRPERRHVTHHFLPGRARVYYQPLGVIGIISPWNYPVSLALMPLISALAAGNRVILKPSELTPATSDLLKTALRGIFPEEQVAVVLGGPEVGAAFSRLAFDHLVFTGSANVGRMVLREAAENLVPVTLELGGKSPAIVGPDADVGAAAGSIAYGKLANAGQSCIAPDYVLVHAKDAANFVSKYEDVARKYYPDGAHDKNYSAIALPRHFTRLQNLIRDAEGKGAEVDTHFENGSGDRRSIGSTILRNATDDMTVMREEIFGPLLPVVTYAALDDAIAYVNRRPQPLALYYFGSDAEDRRKILSRTSSGNVTINDTLMHYVQNALPFGGVGPSGMGSYHGIDGFKAFSHAKGVFEQRRWNLGPLMRPPFNGISDMIVRYMLR
jgi:coniferyl-aldehyde dehydrogenase